MRDAFGAGPGWLFLTGKPEDIHAIRYKLGDRSRVLREHRNEILLGNGATGAWARNNVLGDMDSLSLTVRSMDPKWRPQAGVACADPKPLNFDFASQPGQALYKRLCAGCHTVGSGDRVRPDLAGVMALRDRAWLVSFISDPERMRVGKDPLALALAAKFPPTGRGGDAQEQRIAPLSRPTAWQRRSPSHGRSGLIGHGLQGLVITAEGRSLI